MRLTPTQRAAVVMRLAYETGRGGPPMSRADLVARMFPTPDATPDRLMTSSNDGQAYAVEDGTSAPIPGADRPAPAPDVEITFAAAAARLGVAVATVKRYVRPSSGRLVRMGDGVSLASVEALAA